MYRILEGGETIHLVSKFIKAALELGHVGAYVMEDLASTQATERARKLRANCSRLVVNKGASFAARKHLKIRDEKEEEAYRLRKPSPRLWKTMKNCFQEAAAEAIKPMNLHQQQQNRDTEAVHRERQRNILLRSRQRVI